MSKWIRGSSVVTTTEYVRFFEWRDEPGAGFAYPCDKRGKVQPKNDCQRQGYQDAISGKLGLIDCGVQARTWTYREPAVIRCRCGREVELSDSFANTCACGREYNMAGDLLAPRHLWGEETGEHFACHCGHCGDN